MKEFISADVDSSLSDAEIQNVMMKSLPDFTWRSGDSDMQGKYVSGINGDKVNVKVWMGERPLVLTISFRSLASNILERESKKGALIDLVKYQIIPALGISIKFNA